MIGYAMLFAVTHFFSSIAMAFLFSAPAPLNRVLDAVALVVAALFAICTHSSGVARRMSDQEAWRFILYCAAYLLFFEYLGKLPYLDLARSRGELPQAYLSIVQVAGFSAFVVFLLVRYFQSRPLTVSPGQQHRDDA